MAFKMKTKESMEVSPAATNAQKDAYAEVMARVSVVTEDKSAVVSDAVLRDAVAAVAGKVPLGIFIRRIKVNHDVMICTRANGDWLIGHFETQRMMDRVAMFGEFDEDGIFVGLDAASSDLEGHSVTTKSVSTYGAWS